MSALCRVGVHQWTYYCGPLLSRWKRCVVCDVRREAL